MKDSYWRWPERNLAGNAILRRRCYGGRVGFFVQVLGLSFRDTMRQISGA